MKQEKQFPDGLYIGEFKDNKKNGFGKMTYVSGNVYEGNWEKGKKSGYGKMIYASGNVYEGEWKNNKRNGFGRMIYKKDNSVKEGTWVNDKFVVTDNDLNNPQDIDNIENEEDVTCDITNEIKTNTEQEIECEQKIVEKAKTEEFKEIPANKDISDNTAREIYTTPVPRKRKRTGCLLPAIVLIIIFIIVILSSDLFNSESKKSVTDTTFSYFGTTSSKDKAKDKDNGKDKNKDKHKNTKNVNARDTTSNSGSASSDSTSSDSGSSTSSKQTAVTLNQTELQDIINADTSRSYSVYIKNLNTNEEFKTSDADTQYPALGEVFVPICLVSTNYLNLDSTINFTQADIPSEEKSSSQKYLNNSFSVSQLIEDMMNTSSGTSANKLINLVCSQDSENGFNLINNYLAQNNFANTHVGRLLYDKTSTDDNLISAHDLASMLETISKDSSSKNYSYFAKTVLESNDELQKTFFNDSDLIVGSKFGIAPKPYRNLPDNVYNDAAFVVSKDGKIKFVIAVLSHGSNMNDDAKKTISELALNVYNNIKKQN